MAFGFLYEILLVVEDDGRAIESERNIRLEIQLLRKVPPPGALLRFRNYNNKNGFLEVFTGLLWS
jgi:hypothetical protein